MQYILRKATLSDLDSISPLFNSYRVFYGQSDNLLGSRKFISDRLGNDESTIIIAEDLHNNAVGFMQLYPTFSSIAARKSLILNDLYVDKRYRKKGIGEMFINFAKKYAMEIGVSSLSLETKIDNKIAQNLYEKLGFLTDSTILHYQLKMECEMSRT